MLRIAIRFDPDTLIPDPADIDIDGSIETFADALAVELGDTYPEADIDVTDADRLAAPLLIDVAGAADHDAEDMIRTIVSDFAQRIWRDETIWRMAAPAE